MVCLEKDISKRSIMSNENKRPVPVEKSVGYYQGAYDSAPEVDLTPPVEVVSPPPNPFLMDVDKLQLELAKSNRKTALANAQKALAENEVAELKYKYLVLQIYMRYGLTEADAISETGDIIKGGALSTNPAVK